MTDEKNYRPGSLRGTDSMGRTFVSQPGDPLFSTAIFAATEFLDADGTWRPITEFDEDDEVLTAVYDTDLKRPACVLLQAIGGDRRVAMMFDPSTWLLAPTPGMKRITATKRKWKEVAKESQGA